jgi:hypothetical protein
MRLKARGDYHASINRYGDERSTPVTGIDATCHADSLAAARQSAPSRPTTAEDHPEELSEHWESVHVCQNCDLAINLSEIDLRAVTTGIVSCSRCEWTGRLDIQIISGQPKKFE